MIDFKAISPLDFRYYGRDKDVFSKLEPYLSEESMIRYMASVEAALAKALEKQGAAPKGIAKEMQRAAKGIKAEDVYFEEDRIRHNVRALVNILKKGVSDKNKPFVHFGATSHDIICSADAARYKEFVQDSLKPNLKGLLETLLKKSIDYKKTLQIGRTHGQHAEPITFGYFLAGYADRLGRRIEKILESSDNLRGKISGAVGAYNASSLFVDPIKLEKDTLAELNIRPARHATQVVQPEFMADFIYSIVSTMGVIADLADDLRHLQRTEISEVGEGFGKDQVGSSTMPHKRNPITFENIKSFWKAFSPRMQSVLSDQLCEHQRDLTNSASSRFYPEILAALYIMAYRMKKSLAKLVVDNESMQRNFELTSNLIVAEPLYLILAKAGHPDAHEVVRRIAQKARGSGESFIDLAQADDEVKKYLAKASKDQIGVLRNPQKYVGLAVSGTDSIVKYWKNQLKAL